MSRPIFDQKSEFPRNWPQVKRSTVDPRHHMCMYVCLCMCVRYRVRTVYVWVCVSVCVYARKRERKRDARVRRGWKSQFRRISANGYWPTGRNAVRSPQKTIIINVYDRRAPNWSAFLQSALNRPLTRAIFHYPPVFHVPDYGSPWLTFSNAARDIICNAASGRWVFPEFLARLSDKIDCRLGFFRKFIREKLQSYTHTGERQKKKKKKREIAKALSRAATSRN